MAKITLRPDVSLSAFFVHLLCRHGASAYLPTTPNTPKSIMPVRFTIGDVEGVVMPLKPDE